MSAFEKWQVATSVVQSTILLGTLLVALYIGFKQTEIATRQAEISATQTEISKRLADLPYVVSVEVTYDPSTKRLDVANKGQTNLYLWGTKFGDGPKSIEKDARLINPGGFYYLLVETLESDSLKVTGANGEMRGVLELYVTNQNDVKYTVSTIIYVKTDNGKVTVHTQTVGIQPQEW